MTREQELKNEIKRYNEMLKDAKNDFTTQTWIELQLIEFKRELKSIRKINKLKT